MSHATVMVRLSQARLNQHEGNLTNALDEMLAPYNEQPEDDSPFLKFEDQTEEFRKEWNERTPEHRAEFPYRDFETYCVKYHGAECRNGRWGFSRNPNAKWDWYRIGGRWTGFFPLRANAPKMLGKSGTFDNKPEPNHGDVVKYSDIDFDAVAKATREAMTKWWGEWQKFVETGDEGDAWGGPRRRAMDMGVLRVEKEPGFTLAKNERAISWLGRVKDTDDRRTWTDVIALISEEEFRRNHESFFDSLRTYAFLNDDGWHEPGPMGWWGVSYAEPSDRQMYSDKFNGLLKATQPDDLLVCVDYHI